MGFSIRRKCLGTGRDKAASAVIMLRLSWAVVVLGCLVGLITGK